MDFKVPKMYEDIDLAGFEKIKEILCEDDQKVLHTIKKLTITVKDCRSLAGNNWVNDNIINVFQLLLYEYFNGLYYECSSFMYFNIKRYNGEYKEPTGDLSKYMAVTIPMHVNGNHWIGVIYSQTKNQLLCYDPNSDSFPEDELKLILRFIEHTFNRKEVTIINAVPTLYMPRQKSAYDCGVLVMAFFERRCLSSRPIYLAEHCEYFRMRFLLESATGKKILGSMD